MPVGDVIKSHCNDCGQTTNHTVQGEHRTRWSEAIDEEHGVSIDGGKDYRIVECCGCGDVSFLRAEWFSEDTDAEGYPVLKEDRFPLATPRRYPDWFSEEEGVPTEILALLAEIYAAFGSDSLRLCALGIRALVEQIMIEQIGGDKGGLGNNITAFLAAGFVAPRDHQQFREKVIEVGNAAMHRGYSPRESDVATLLDIVEAMIATIYVHPRRAQQVGADMPARRPRKS